MSNSYTYRPAFFIKINSFGIIYYSRSRNVCLFKLILSSYLFNYFKLAQASLVKVSIFKNIYIIHFYCNNKCVKLRRQQSPSGILYDGNLKGIIPDRAKRPSNIYAISLTHVFKVFFPVVCRVL